MALLPIILGIAVVVALLFMIYCHMKEIELDLNRAGYFGYGILALLSGASILIAVFLNAFIPQELQKMFEINLSGFNDFLLPLFIGGLMSTVNGISTTKKAFSKDLKKTAE